MSKRIFNGRYYTLEDTSHSKTEINKLANKYRVSGKYLVRVALTGWGASGDKWGVWITNKK